MNKNFIFFLKKFILKKGKLKGIFTLEKEIEHSYKNLLRLVKHSHISKSTAVGESGKVKKDFTIEKEIENSNQNALQLSRHRYSFKSTTAV